MFCCPNNETLQCAVISWATRTQKILSYNILKLLKRTILLVLVKCLLRLYASTWIKLELRISKILREKFEL